MRAWRPAVRETYRQITGIIDLVKTRSSVAGTPRRARMPVAVMIAPAMLARSAGEGTDFRSLLRKPRSKAFSKLARIWLAAAPISGWLSDSTVAVPTTMQPGRFGGLV